ncbi:unnamed protein product, partial [Rotaria magnacalcarata]
CKKLLRGSNDGSDSHPSRPSVFYSSIHNTYSVQKPNIYHRVVPFSRSYINRNIQKYPTINNSRQDLVKSIEQHHAVNQNIKKSNPSLIFINTLVNGSRLRAMIDTGATHSFITQRALSTLYHSVVPSCDCIAQLGDVFTPLNALVVRTMNTDFILGSDWCTKNAAKIDYEKNQVSIRSSRGRTFIPYHKSIECLSLDVKSINVIHIPPRESYTVQAKVELSSADTVYFSPVDAIQSKKSIVMSPSLLHISNYTTYLEVYNPHDYTYTLPMNTLLGRITHTPYQMHSCLLSDTSREYSSLSSQRHILNTIDLEQNPSVTSHTIDKLITHIKNV